MRVGAIILPNQLYEDSPLFSVASEFYLIEHARFLGDLETPTWRSQDAYL